MKQYERVIYYDIYRKIAKIFVKMGSKLSICHDGKLNKSL